MDNQPSVLTVEAGDVIDVSGSGKAGEPDSVAVLSLQDRIKWLEQHAVKTVGLLY